jgi:EAL domain-containing protein (putative c-di-GMP-specific phosphodiesterase class I)
MTEKPSRILFVDDEPQVTQALHVALRKEPWEIATASSAEEALDLLSRSPFDVIVSDERMPGLHGSDFLSIVREAHPETVRIILSGQADLEAAVKAINSAEIHRFLLKPCPPEEVRLTIYEALAKREERHRFEAWRRIGRDREQLEAVLDRAQESLWMGFQPIVRSAGETIFGYEALARSNDPDLSHPLALFGAAEELGRARELSARIRAAIAGHIPQAPAGATILVNVNPKDLTDEDLYSREAPLTAHAERVVLEITERQALEPGEELQDRVKRLRALGFRVAVDDLGAGYAGLTSFAVLTPEFMKLDMELVRNIDCSRTKRDVVQALCGVCHGLGITSIAEGVETCAERDVLVDVGCDLLQGFYYGAAQRGFCADVIRQVA